MLGSGGGGAGQRELSCGSEGHSGGSVQKSGSVLRALFCGFVLCIPLFCVVAVAVPFVCCSVKLPLSRPTSFLPVFFPFSSTPRRGEGRLRGAFVAGCSRKPEHLIGAQHGAGITAGLSSEC